MRGGDGQRRSHSARLISTSIACLALFVVAGAQSYTVVDLGTLPGGNSSFAAGISNSGWVTGNASDASNNSWAFLYRYGGSLMNLGGLAGATNSIGTSVNNFGQVTGNSDLGTGISHSVLWSGGVITNMGSLGSPANAYNSFGFGVNDIAQTAGMSGGVFGTHAFIWSSLSGMTDVFAATGMNDAMAINNAGHYVGGAAGNIIRYVGGVATVLGPGAGFAINDLDQIAGYQPGPMGNQATLFSGTGVPSPLGSLGGDSSIAFGVNNAGVVVGTSDVTPGTSDPHAFIYTGGTMQDLNAMIPVGSGWLLQEARGINDAGVIVGNGIVNGESHGFMLIPDGADFSAPTTEAALSGTLTARRVGFKSSDSDDPVASTTYTINGGATQTYQGPFAVGTGGTKVVQFSSTDSHGNVEPTHQLDVVHDPVANNYPVSVQYDTVTSPGNASVTVSTSGTPPNGYSVGTPARYYDITTTASFTGDVIVGISYSGVAFGAGGTPRIFHMEAGNWVDSTYAVDTVNRIVYAKTSSLSPFGVFAPLPPFLSLTVSPTSVYNGTSATANLTLNFPVDKSYAPWNPALQVTGQYVRISTNSAAAIPPTGPTPSGGNVVDGPDGFRYLFIPQGQSSIDFAVNTSQVSTNTIAKLTVVMNGSSKFVNLTVVPERPSSVTLSPTTVYNGGTSTGTVTLTNPAFTMDAPWGGGTNIPGAFVKLTSGNAVVTFQTGPNPDGSNVFVAPDGFTYLHVPQGNTTGTFVVNTDWVPANTTVALSANANGQTRSANLTITPEKVASVALSPTSVYNGGTTTGTVTLTNPAFRMDTPWGGGTNVPGAFVKLTTGNAVVTYNTGPNPDGSNVFTAPDGFTYLHVPQGNTTGTFTATTGSVTANTTVTLTATLFASVRSANLVVTPERVSSVSILPSTVYNGGSTTGTVTLTNPAFMMDAPWGGGTNIPGAFVLLTSGNPVGSFNTGPNPDGSNVFNAPDGNTYLHVPQGATTGTFTATTTWVSANTTVALTANMNGSTRTANLTVTPEKVLSVSLLPTSVYNGASSTGTVTLTNPAFIMDTPWGGGSNVPGAFVRLTSGNAAGTFQTGPNPDGSNVFNAPDGFTYVHVPQGATTGTFVVNTTAVPASTADAITATLFASTRTATLTIRPTQVSTFTLTPLTLSSGQTASGTVTLNGAALTMDTPWGSGTVPGVFVLLTSSDPLATFPTGPNPDGSNVFVAPDGNTYLHIPQGNTTGTVTVLAGTVPAQTTSVISAALNGVTRSRTVTLKP